MNLLPLCNVPQSMRQSSLYYSHPPFCALPTPYSVCFNCSPIYQPSEDRLTYTAVRTVSLEKSSVTLDNGAVNKLLEQYSNGDSSNAPLLLTAADIKDSLVLSDVSLFIDAAFVPNKDSNRRWLQVL